MSLTDFFVFEKGLAGGMPKKSLEARQQRLAPRLSLAPCCHHRRPPCLAAIATSTLCGHHRHPGCRCRRAACPAPAVGAARACRKTAPRLWATGPWRAGAAAASPPRQPPHWPRQKPSPHLRHRCGGGLNESVSLCSLRLRRRQGRICSGSRATRTERSRAPCRAAARVKSFASAP